MFWDVDMWVDEVVWCLVEMFLFDVVVCVEV